MKTSTDTAAGAAPKPPTRREKERLAHRAAILDAAERVFAAKGFPGATIAEIAREAEFAVGSIYNFFPGKRELAEAVMLRIATERVEEVEREVLPLAAASGEVFTDDAQVMERFAPTRVFPVEHDFPNPKITYRPDLEICRVLLKLRREGAGS